MRGLKINVDIQWERLRIPVILALIVALALFLRVYWAIGPSLHQGLAVSGGSDSYYHEKIILYILNSKHQLINDPMLNYPIGTNNPRPPLFHWAIVMFSYIFYPFMSPEKAAILMLILFPAIWGSLTVIPVYLLGKEAFNKKVGLIAAFFLAILPADLMRSVATQADWDAFNLFFIVLSFYFFLRALKTVRYLYWIKDWFNPGEIKEGLNKFFKENADSVTYAALSGASLGTVALAWKGFTYALAILVIYLLVQVLINRFRNKSNLHMVVFMGIYMLVAFGMAFPWYYVTHRLGQWFFVPLFLIGSVFVIGLILEITGKYPWPFVFGVVAGITALALVIINMFFPDLWMLIVEGQGYFVKSKLYSTIAEAQPASLGYIAMSFGVAIFIVSFLGVFEMLYLIRKEKEEYYLFFVFYSIIAIYMAISAARFIFNASPAFALAGAVGVAWLIDKLRFSETYEELRRYRGNWKKKVKVALKFSQVTFVLVLAFLLIVPTVWSAIDAGIPYESKKKYDKEIYNTLPSFMKPNETAYNKSAPWFLGAFGYSIPKETYPWPRAWKWLRSQDNSTPPEDRPAFVSWWDYGFEAVREGQHPTVADNFQKGYQMAAQIITAQNESEVISLFIIRILEGDYAHHGNSFSAGMLKILEKRFSPEEVDKIKEAMRDPSKFREVVLSNPDYYGYYESDISDVNTKYAYLKGMFAHHKESFLIGLYDDVRNYTGYDIRYFAVDYRLFPFSGRNTGIFYAPAKLGDRRIHEYGGTVVPYDFYDLKAVDTYGNEYELDKIPANVHITNYKIYYKPMFYHSMLYRTFIGYSGKDVGANDGIPGISPGLYNYYPMQAWNMSHFKLVYRTAYWNPYKDYQNHSKDWKPIPIDLALKYQREGKGVVELNPPAYQVLPNDVVMVKFYEGAIIEGYVKLSTGVPLKHVRVTLQDEYNIPHVSVFTDDNGYFRIPAVAGNLTLTISTNGNLNKLNLIEKTVLKTIHINVTEEQAMRLKPNYRIYENITIKPASLDGVVYYDLNHDGKFDKGDQKLSAATVILTNNTYGYNESTPVKNGLYSLKEIPPHRYTVNLIINGKEYKGVNNVTLSAGQNLTWDIGLKPPIIYGNVTYMDGRPASNATVTINGDSGRYVVTANNNGSFKAIVPPGNYTVIAEKEDYVSANTLVSIPGWNSNRSVNITIHHAFELEGELIYGGDPVKGVTLKITSELLPHSVYLIKTDKNGKFAIKLPVGIYSIYTTTFVDGTRVVYLNVINLDSNKHMLLTMQRAYRLSGYVNTTEKITSIEVGIYKGTVFYRAFANNTGYFEAYLPEGHYNIGVVGFNLTNKPYFGKTTVSLNSDRTVKIIMHRAYNVTGVAYYDKNSNGVADQNETITNGLVYLYNDQGIYEIRNIPPSGKFTLPTTIDYKVGAIIWGYTTSSVEIANKVKIEVVPSKVLLKGKIYYGSKENNNPVNMLFVNQNNPIESYTLHGVKDNYAIHLPPGNYTIALFGYNRSYQVNSTIVHLPLGYRDVWKNITYRAFAHVEVISQATHVTWYVNGKNYTTGKEVELPLGEYTVYAWNTTYASIETVDISQNTTLQIELSKGYPVIINVENYSYSPVVDIYTDNAHISVETSSVILPEGEYTFVINKTRLEGGEYYRYYSINRTYIDQERYITLQVIKRKVEADIEGVVHYMNHPLSNCVVRFISLEFPAKNTTAVTDTAGRYIVKLTPGSYMVYASYIEGSQTYAHISYLNVTPGSTEYRINMKKGYVLSGATYMLGHRINTVIHIKRGKGVIDVPSYGYYWVILPDGNYTVSASKVNKEYGMNIKYSFEGGVYLKEDTSYDLHLKRNTVHYLDSTIISVDNWVKPNTTMGIALYIRNYGNIAEKIKFESVGEWTIEGSPNYTLLPGDRKIVYLAIHVPYNAKYGSHSLQIRMVYSGHTKDITAYTNVSAVYNTNVTYKLVRWNNNSIEYTIEIKNLGNKWCNYTVRILNKDELESRGWEPHVEIGGSEITWVNVTDRSSEKITIIVEATKDLPGTSVPLIVDVYGEKANIIKIPLTYPHIENSVLYVKGKEVHNYSGVTIDPNLYWIWGATIAVIVAIIWLGRYRR